MLYTDGAFEGKSAFCGIRAERCSSRTCPRRVEAPLVDGAQVEMFGVLCGLAALEAELSGQRVILFVGGQKGDSKPLHVSQQVSFLEAECNMRVWVERVPSYSNPVDLPFRLQTHKLPRPLRAQDRGGFDLPRPLWEPLLV